MTDNQLLVIKDVEDVTVVRFLDRRIVDEGTIQELGNELYALVEEKEKRKLLLNFSDVDFLSSAALGKLIALDKKVKKTEGQMRLSNVCSNIMEVFALTKLDKHFKIEEEEADALASLSG